MASIGYMTGDSTREHTPHEREERDRDPRPRDRATLWIPGVRIVDRMLVSLGGSGEESRIEAARKEEREACIQELEAKAHRYRTHGEILLPTTRREVLLDAVRMLRGQEQEEPKS